MDEEEKQFDKIPEHIIDSLARSFLPEIQFFFGNEANKREFEEWLEEKEKIKNIHTSEKEI